MGWFKVKKTWKFRLRIKPVTPNNKVEIYKTSNGK